MKLPNPLKLPTPLLEGDTRLLLVELVIELVEFAVDPVVDNGLLDRFELLAVVELDDNCGGLAVPFPFVAATE